jgi:hypothetical protein
MRQSHPLFRYYKEFLTAAVFVECEDDVEQHRATLQERGLSKDETDHMRPKYFRKRMVTRRLIPKACCVKATFNLAYAPHGRHGAQHVYLFIF